MLQNQTLKPANNPVRSPQQARNVRPGARNEPTEDEIRLRAFQIYERRNREPGHEAEDWAQAERELRGQQ